MSWYPQIKVDGRYRVYNSQEYPAIQIRFSADPRPINKFYILINGQSFKKHNSPIAETFPTLKQAKSFAEKSLKGKI